MKITEPVLLLDKEKCLANIKKMVTKAKKLNIRLRPHTKTHQSAEIASWCKEAGIDSITVSSLKMAEYFADNGWQDITVAFPVNILELERINKLAGRVTLNCLVEAAETVGFLAANLKHKIGLFIKIDVGYHRTGIDVEAHEEIDNVISEIRNSGKGNLHFKGFLTHAGHSYNAASKEEIMHIHNSTVRSMLNLKNMYKITFPQIEISIGDTPCCCRAEDFEGIDEIRPGNFVFFDVMQYFLGSCTAEEIAVVLACPVVAKHAERNEITLYGGGVHLSKEYITNRENVKIFGLPVFLEDKGWGKIMDGAYVASLSQEHGNVKVPAQNFHNIAIGDVIGIIPVHSCMTANLMKRYLTLDDNFVEMMD